MSVGSLAPPAAPEAKKPSCGDVEGSLAPPAAPDAKKGSDDVVVNGEYS
jgi:hypothetical protein